eukprot:m.212347 g.212347  ORF g.212347 m.212347 type:complete len:135 (+) comp25526_c3_seq1:40-444(+)
MCMRACKSTGCYQYNLPPSTATTASTAIPPSVGTKRAPTTTTSAASTLVQPRHVVSFLLHLNLPPFEDGVVEGKSELNSVRLAKLKVRKALGLARKVIRGESDTVDLATPHKVLLDLLRRCRVFNTSDVNGSSI